MNACRTCAALLLALLAIGCERGGSEPYHDQFFAFGTLIDLTLHSVERDVGDQASAWIEQDFREMHADWHTWQEGQLARINAKLKNGEAAPADAPILALIREANRLSEQSGGLFNPVIGELVALWGFHDNPLPIGTLPDPKKLASLIARLPGTHDIRIEDGRIRSTNPHAHYDLGAFAKGYAIDRGIELLREFGVENAIINAGGDLRAIGRHGDRPWRIGIRHPRRPVVLASIEIDGDESIFTSGDYERYFEIDGKRYHHIIDPRSGHPADQTSSVTVIHDNAATADAAATALFVAGPLEWPAVAARMGIELAMLIDKDGVIHTNPAMQSRLQFEPGIETQIHLVESPL